MKVQSKTSKSYNIDQLHSEIGSWSGVIRFLSKEGISRGEISKLTGKRYQHVRNVLITPLKSK